MGTSSGPQPGAIKITSYKPTSRYLSACPDLDCFQLADKPEIVSLLDF
jgi:hypothetical protein